VNLSVKKLRRSTTVLGGSFLGLGIALALVTPALACNSTITGEASCVNADGTWSVTWSVTSDENQVPGTVLSVDETPTGAKLTNIVANAPIPAQGHGVLTGVESLTGTDTQASIQVTASYFYNGSNHAVKADSPWINKPDKVCTPPSTPPTTVPTTPPTTTPTTAPTPTPTVSAPETTPGLIYKETCTTFTVGIKVPETWKKSETAIFTPSTGTAKTVTAKPGEIKTVDFPASKNLSVEASVKGYKGEKPLTITYKAPASCTSPAPSTSGPVLAVTGSSSAPLAGGAVALVLLGGGAFFLARRRKMRFTA
jgi:LPXTG-motif cell wall-anchored protein